MKTTREKMAEALQKLGVGSEYDADVYAQAALDVVLEALQAGNIKQEVVQVYRPHVASDQHKLARAALKAAADRLKNN